MEREFKLKRAANWLWSLLFAFFSIFCIDTGFEFFPASYEIVKTGSITLGNIQILVTFLLVTIIPVLLIRVIYISLNNYFRNPKPRFFVKSNSLLSPSKYGEIELPFSEIKLESQYHKDEFLGFRIFQGKKALGIINKASFVDSNEYQELIDILVSKNIELVDKKT